MRTKGPFYRRRWRGTLPSVQGSLYISPDKKGDDRVICSFGGGSVQYANAEENSAHVLACLAAIEAIGGEPGMVGELVAASRDVASELKTMLAAQRHADCAIGVDNEDCYVTADARVATLDALMDKLPEAKT